MAKLYQVTGDDDQRAPEDVMRAIVKASVRAKEPAMRDMATWLGKRLATDHCGAKVKVLRLIIMVISHPKGSKWADAFTSRLQSGGLTCRTLVGDEYAKAMLEKHVWICAFMMTGALNGGITVGEVESQHTEQLRGLVTELCAAGEKALGVTLEAGVFERLTAYGRSVHFFPTAVKEFEWRNGWFYDITNAALAAGQPDPMPLHTAGLKALSVIE